MRTPTLPAAIASEFDRMRNLTAANLRHLMNEKDRSRRRVARELQLTPRYVDSRATGTVEMSASDLALFATYLGVPVSSFYDETPREEAEVAAPITRLEPKGPASDYRYDLLDSPVVSILDRIQAQSTVEHDAIVTPFPAKAGA